MNTARLVILAVVASALLLAGCQSSQVRPVDVIEDKPTQTLKSFAIEGKIGLRSEKVSQSVFIRWKQNGDDFDIVLHGPLGQGRVNITRTLGVTTFARGDDIDHAISTEKLLHRKTGVWLPIEQLVYWVQGQPHPGSPSEGEQLDERGLYQRFIQDQCELDFLQYSPVGGRLLPDKLRIVREQYQLTLIVKDWQL